MNNVFILLIILNISLLAWNTLFEPAHKPVTVPLTDPTIPELIKTEKVPKVVYSSALAPTQSSCFTIGPYDDRATAQQVQERINNFGLAVKMRAIRSLETLNFLVYIPPLPSPIEAEKVLTDLKKFNVKNAVIMEQESYKNAISLGVFNDAIQAKRHTEYIRYLGYDARHIEQQVTREVFWLDYDEPFGSNTPVSAWSKAFDQNTDVQKIPRACQS